MNIQEKKKFFTISKFQMPSKNFLISFIHN